MTLLGHRKFWINFRSFKLRGWHWLYPFLVIKKVLSDRQKTLSRILESTIAFFRYRYKAFLKCSLSYFKAISHSMNLFFELVVACFSLSCSRHQECVTAKAFKCKPPEVHFTVRNRVWLIAAGRGSKVVDAGSKSQSRVQCRGPGPNVAAGENDLEFEVTEWKRLSVIWKNIKGEKSF